MHVMPEGYSTLNDALKSIECGRTLATPSGLGAPKQVSHSQGVLADQCWIAMDDESNTLWVMLQSSDASSVDYKMLSPGQKKLFNKSRNKEIANLLQLGAYRILSVEESIEFRRKYPDCVLPSRWVDRYKATDEGGVDAKSRIVILGFKDPQVLQLERSAPTPTHEAFMTVMQSLASTRRSAWSSDIRNAFAQSRKTTRTQPIAASLPTGMAEAGFDLDPRQLLLCETEVYGLISGPSWLRQSLVCDFEQLGYVRNPYDKCIMTLAPPDTAKQSDDMLNSGIILIEVDDILEGGDDHHQRTIEKFYDKYKCGKRKKIQDLGEEGTLISGIRVVQKQDYSFAWNMNEYAETMEIINIPRGFMTHTKELSEEYASKVLSCNGQIGWIGGNGRPDLAAGHSIIAGTFKDKSPQLVADCNQCVKQAKEHKIVMKIWSIPPADLRCVTFADSSFDFKGVRHQQGWIVGFTNKFLNQNRRAPVSIALWKSRKLGRKAGSPQLVETYAASGAAADTNWVRCILYSCMYRDYDIQRQRPRHFGMPNLAPTVLRSDRASVIDPEVSLLSDSKGLYDALNNELPQDDKKSAVEMPIIEQILKNMNGRSRWIPHNFNPADGLTKLKGAHLAPLMDLLKTGMYHLKTEEAQLKQRADVKAVLGNAPRLKCKTPTQDSDHTSDGGYCGFVVGPRNLSQISVGLVMVRCGPTYFPSTSKGTAQLNSNKDVSPISLCHHAHNTLFKSPVNLHPVPSCHLHVANMAFEGRDCNMGYYRGLWCDLEWRAPYERTVWNNFPCIGVNLEYYAHHEVKPSPKTIEIDRIDGCREDNLYALLCCPDLQVRGPVLPPGAHGVVDLPDFSQSRETMDGIRKAYRRQALIWHPDKHKNNNNTKPISAYNLGIDVNLNVFRFQLTGLNGDQIGHEVQMAIGLTVNDLIIESRRQVPSLNAQVYCFDQNGAAVGLADILMPNITYTFKCSTADRANTRFRWINNANEILSCPNAKRFWDRMLWWLENPHVYHVDPVRPEYGRPRAKPVPKPKAKTKAKAKATPRGTAGTGYSRRQPPVYAPSTSDDDEFSPSDSSLEGYVPFPFRTGQARQTGGEHARGAGEREMPNQAPYANDADDGQVPNQAPQEPQEPEPRPWYRANGWSWADLCEEFGPTSQVQPKDFPDAKSWIRWTFPGRTFSEYDCVEKTMELCKKGNLVKIPWYPSAQITLTANGDVHVGEEKISSPLPERLGNEPECSYYHGTYPYNTCPIRRWGLRALKPGAGTRYPAIYTSKNRRVPFEVYSPVCSFWFQRAVHPKHPEEPVWIEKHFKCLIGIGSNQPWPYHDFAVYRTPAHKKQFGFTEDHCEPLWIELLCCDRNGSTVSAGEEPILDQRHWVTAARGFKRTHVDGNRARCEQAEAMTTTITDHVWLTGDVPQPRAKRACIPSSSKKQALTDPDPDPPRKRQKGGASSSSHWENQQWQDEEWQDEPWQDDQWQHEKWQEDQWQNDWDDKDWSEADWQGQSEPSQRERRKRDRSRSEEPKPKKRPRTR